MKLWLLRHGAAEAYQKHDADRQLTEQGRQQILQAAEFLRGVNFDRVLSSPYIRARQTTELICAALPYAGTVEIVPWLTPEDDVREVASGYECGMSIERFNDIKEGDVIEAFEVQEIERS